MDGRTFKILHWHIITWIYFIISYYSLERPLCITLVQRQVGRTFRPLWGMSLAKSFDWRGRISLDGWNCLDGHHINHRIVQVYLRSKFWNLGKRSLTRFLLFRTSTTWKVIKVHCIRYGLGLSLPCLDGRFLDDWGYSSVFITTCNSLFPILFHGSHSCNKEYKV